MSAPAVFQGTFSDFRIVKGRKVVQIMVEVPSELANAALGALGGIPDPSNPVWVAVARLDAKQAVAEQPKQLPAPDKKRWEDMAPAQQAAIRCGEPAFIRFLDEVLCTVHGWGPPTNSEEAAQLVRHFCKVESRSELNKDRSAAELWKRLDSDFWLWSRGYQQ